VIETGTASAGDTMTRIDNPFPQWTVARVFSLLIKGEGKSEPEALEQLAELEPLSGVWRAKAAALLGR
ncbi:MAG: 3-alpha domain-containing protein, partial [Parasphingopyxis sp.]